MPQELPHRVDERGAVGGDLAVADAMHEAQRREVERAQAGHLDEAAVGEDHEGGDALGAGDRAAHRAQVLEQRLVGRREAGGGAVDEQAAFPASRRRRRSGSARSRTRSRPNRIASPFSVRRRPG